MNQQFEFDPIDKPRLATIFSTYQSPIINDEYTNFIQHLKLLRTNIVKNSLQISPDCSFNFVLIDYKLTHIFLSQIFFNTKTEDIDHEEVKQYFSPVFELFDCCKFSIDTDLFVKICNDLQLTIYALHFKQCYQLQLSLTMDDESEEFFQTLWISIRECYTDYIYASDSFFISKTKMFTSISNYVSNRCQLIEKVFFIATDGQDNCNHSNKIDLNKHDEWVDNFSIWSFEFMIKNIHQYHKIALFDFIHKNLEITMENPIEYLTKAQSNYFWTSWIQANQAIENYDLIFLIITSDELRSYPRLHQKLFELSFIVLVYRNLENVSLMRRLFSQRINCFSLKSFSFIHSKSSSYLLIDKQFLDLKVKFDSENFWSNTIVHQTTFRILYGTFIDPEHSLNHLMNQIVMHHSNFLHRYMAHLFGNQLVDILNASSGNVTDIISFSSNEDEHELNLSIIDKLLLQIIIDKCDLIQMNNLRNLLNNLHKFNLIESERLFAYLLAYFDHESSAAAINYQLKLLKSVPELFRKQKSKWTGKHFSLITAYLFDILFKFWNEPIQRELICDVIDTYLQNCNPHIINEREIDSLYSLLLKRSGSYKMNNFDFDVSIIYIINEYLLFSS